MIGWCINACVAVDRISEFLEVDNITGMRPKLLGAGETNSKTIIDGSSRNPLRPRAVGLVRFNNASFHWNAVRAEEDEVVDTAKGSRCCFSRASAARVRRAPVNKSMKDKLTAFFNGSGSVKYTELQTMNDLSEESFEFDIENGVLLDQKSDSKIGVGRQPFSLRNIDVTVPKGKLLAIIGPTGSGSFQFFMRTPCKFTKI